MHCLVPLLLRDGVLDLDALPLKFHFTWKKKDEFTISWGYMLMVMCVRWWGGAVFRVCG